jgi:hypothetical protein
MAISEQVRVLLRGSDKHAGCLTHDQSIKELKWLWLKGQSSGTNSVPHLWRQRKTMEKFLFQRMDGVCITRFLRPPRSITKSSSRSGRLDSCWARDSSLSGEVRIIALISKPIGNSLLQSPPTLHRRWGIHCVGVDSLYIADRECASLELVQFTSPLGVDHSEVDSVYIAYREFSAWRFGELTSPIGNSLSETSPTLYRR